MTLELVDINLSVGGENYLSNISAQMQPGCFNCLLGRTLSGKTSLLRLLAGLEVPTSGSILLNGQDITKNPAKKRNVAFVYQQFINYPNLTVFENIASPLRVAKTSRTEIPKRVEATAELLGLSAFLAKKPLELSGGQQQRVSMARALVKDADIILMDEPLANLDYKLREDLRSELPALLQQKGAVIVYATTEPEEALLLGDQAFLMHEGRLVQTGASAHVHAEPTTLIAAKTFSDPPLNCYAAGQSNSDIAVFCDSAGAQTVAVRPHHVRIGKADTGEVSISGTVLGTDITGADSYIHLDVDGFTWTVLASGTHVPDTGSVQQLAVQKRNLMAFADDGSVMGDVGQHG